MSCSDFDIKGYVLKEVSAEERERVEAHLPACGKCREELERLRLTQTSLLSLRDEEIPQRIAFISDKVFEPNWWLRFWRSAPRLGFAGAAMLSVAIFVNAYTRPAPVIAPASLDAAAVARIVERQVAKKLDKVVVEAVAEAERRNDEKTAELLQQAAETYELQRRGDLLAVQQSFEYLHKQLNVMQLASAYRDEAVSQ